MADNQYLDEVERLQRLGRYGDAYRYTQEHEADLELTTDLGELRRVIRQQARDAVEQARAELDIELARDPADFDRDQGVEEWVAQWRRAVMGDSDAELESYERRVRTRRADQAEYQIYNLVYREVQDLWDRAQRESEASATAGVLQALYNQANDIAQQAASEHPDNTRLQALAQQASARRERAGIETEALTSGALLGQHVKTLVYIDSIPDGEMIPSIDRYGNIGERRPKTQVRAEVADQARAFVDSTVVKYIDEAKRSLQNYLPRAARDTLNQYHKFEEREDPGLNLEDMGRTAIREVSLVELLGGNWLSADRLRDIERLERDIELALGQLNEAEQRAQAALDVLDRDIVQAWRYYNEALDTYEGARNSSVIQNAQNALETTANRWLAEAAEQIDVLIRDQNLVEAEHNALALLDNFRPMQGELRIESPVRAIEEMHTALQTVREQLGQIDAALNDGNLNAAAARLRTLEADYQLRRYYEAHPDYDRVKSQVTFGLDAEAELDRLREFLSNPRRDKVQRALESARAAAEQNTAFDQQFDNLVLNLEAHLLLLDADRLLSSEGHDTVIVWLEEAVSQDGLRPDLRTRLDECLATTRQRSQELDQSRAMLERGQQLLAEGNPSEAYQQLKKIKSVANRAERQTLDRALVDARDQWVQQLVALFRDITIETEFDRGQMKEALDDLEELNPDRADRVKRQYRLCEGAQLARDHATAGRLDAALEQWNNMLESQPGWAETTYIRKQIAQVNKQQKGAQIERLLEPAEHGANEEARREWISDLIKMASGLAEDATNASHPVDRIEYTLWRVQTTLMHAQYTPDLKTRRQLLHDVSDTARSLEGQIRTVDRADLTAYERRVIDHTETVIPVALAGPAIGDAMRAVEEHLQVEAEIALFRQAYVRWHETFAPYRDTLPALRRWFDENVRAVQGDLREALRRLAGDDLENYADLTPESLPLYAKLLVLDEEDPAGLWMLQQLTGLSARIETDVERLGAAAFSGDGIQPGKGLKALEDKRANVQSYRDYVRLVREMVQLFTHLTTLRDQGRALLGTCASQTPILDRLHMRLEQFITAGMDIEAFINAYQLHDDGRDSWHNFSGEFRAAWNNFEIQIREIAENLDQHPWVVNELRTRFTKRLNDLSNLVGLLRGIQDDMQVERFIEADQRADVVDGSYRTLFAPSMPLYGEYRVKDVWTSSDVIGWRDVRPLIERRRSQFERVYTWAEAFGAPDRVERADLDPGLRPLPAPNVVRWPEIQQEARTWRDAGVFPRAYDLIGMALNGPDDGSLMGLLDALEAVSYPPVAEAGENQTGDYMLAQRRAGSQRGYDILEWMHCHRYQRYERYIQDARRELDAVNTTQSEWTRLTGQYTGMLARMDDVLNERMNRGRRRQLLTPLVDHATGVLMALRDLCPDHPQLDNLERNPVLEEARRGAG
ncbi:MAG: hypothetical protein JXQ72_08020 [Anaerolineae bacterium]|nr:hypothetical protein [Anaerolineae bacterium]